MRNRTTSTMLDRCRPDHILKRQRPRVYIHSVFGLYLSHQRIEVSPLDKVVLAFLEFDGVTVGKLFPCRRKRGGTGRKIGEVSSEGKVRLGDKTSYRAGRR